LENCLVVLFAAPPTGFRFRQSFCKIWAKFETGFHFMCQSNAPTEYWQSLYTILCFNERPFCKVNLG